MEYIYIGLNLDINSHLEWLNKNLPHRKLDLYESGLDLHADLDIDVFIWLFSINLNKLGLDLRWIGLVTKTFI